MAENLLHKANQHVDRDHVRSREHDRYLLETLTGLSLCLALLFGALSVMQFTWLDSTLLGICQVCSATCSSLYVSFYIWLREQKNREEHARLWTIWCLVPMYAYVVLQQFLIPTQIAFQFACMALVVPGILFISIKEFIVAELLLLGSVLVAQRLQGELGIHLPYLGVASVFVLLSASLSWVRSKRFQARLESHLSEEFQVRELARIAREALDAETRFRMLADSVPHAIFETDSSGVPSYGNDHWAELQNKYGISKPEPWYNLVDESSRSEIVRQWDLACEQNRPLSHGCRLVFNGEEERWVEITLNPTSSRSGVNFVGTVVDITSEKHRYELLRKNAEQARSSKETQERYAKYLRRVNSDLRIANRLAEQSVRTKSEFLANMTHEIRTPMTAILGFAELLLETSTDSKTLHGLKTIQRNGQHLLSIINDILDLSKIEAGMLEIDYVRCSIPGVVQEVVDMVSIQATQRGIDFITEIDSETPEEILADPLRLKQVLINLVGNALKFTQEGSVRIHVGVVTSDTDNSWAKLKFDIIDTGIGISKEKQSQLFKPFTQADGSISRKYGGTGLGLSISQKLAEAFKGEIQVESEQGRGSCFSFMFSAQVLQPANKNRQPVILRASETILEETSPQVPEEPEIVASDERKLRVCLVDDCIDNTRLLSFLLRKKSFRCTSASSGREAIHLIDEARHQGDEFDVVLLDIQMPEMDGWSTLKEIKKRGHSLSAIACTAYSPSRTEESDYWAAGFEGLLEKPIDQAKLYSALDKIIDQKHGQLVDEPATPH